MGVLSKLKGLGKKEWDKGEGEFAFVLQELAVGVKGGWHDVTEATQEKISKDEASQYFKPSCYYRVLVKNLETGRMVGVAWKHMELGALRPKEKEKKEDKGEPQPQVTPKDVMMAYAQEVKEVMEPFAALAGVFKEIRESFSFGENPSAGAGTSYPPLEFEGKPPWPLHPYIVKNVGDMIVDVSDRVASRWLGPEGKKEKEEEEEAESISLPRISSYRKRPTVRTRGARRTTPPVKSEAEETESPLEEEKE